MNRTKFPSSMAVRVLLLEDSAFDAELITANLLAGGLVLDLHRVWTRERFIEALSGRAFDVILADHVLPQFDGDAALELARVLAPDIPFIFVSGTLTEELAVKALKRGATDYVVKQRLQRLPDAVQRAISEAKERRNLELTERALRESRERLHLIANSLPVLIAYVDTDLRYRFNNSAYEEWFGYSLEELRGRHLRELAGEEAFKQIRPVVERALAGERVSFEGIVPYQRTSLRHVHIDYIPERQADGTVTGFYALVQNISQRKAAETALRQLNETLESQVQERTVALHKSEARLRAIFESSFQHQGLIALDGNLLDANHASLETILSTRAEVIDKPYWDTPWFTATPGMSALIRRGFEQAAAGGPFRQELILDLPTGRRSFDFSMRPLRDANGVISAVVPEAVETTEQRQAEEALRQAQKMEAVGQLTGGIAHDFNNLLTVITGNVGMVKDMLESTHDPQPRMLRSLDNAMKGAYRAAALTQRLLAFSRRQPLQPRRLDLNRLTGGMYDMLKRSLGEAIELSVVSAPELWQVEADPNQLEAAILNLALNARDAMPDGGRLVIETANTHLDQAYAENHDELTPGHYVVVSVRDSGFGMSNEILARVFEPFFTTKEVGRGTGLGLSMVYGFTRQSGGHVQIQSTMDVGTVVSLFLPRLLGGAAVEAEETAHTETRRSLHEETILVAEDDDDVRAYVVECLRGLGYRVLEAHDGPSALRLLERNDTTVQLLFTDVVMPGMSGRELVDRARILRPDLRILYASGYMRDAVAQGGRLDLDIAFLPKPFTYTSLAAKVREVLE